LCNLPIVEAANRAATFEARTKLVECRGKSDQHIRISDKALEQAIQSEIQRDPKTKRELINIYYDQWRFKKLPRYILNFELARECVIVTQNVKPASRASEIPTPAPSGSTLRPSESLTPYEIDCRAINLLRKQRLVGYRETQDIVKFYARYKTIDKKERGDPRRAKNISGCFSFYKQLR